MARKTLVRDQEPLYPEHPKREHELRVDRVRETMEEIDLDAVVFSRNVTVFYMTGSRFVFVGFDKPMALAAQSTATITLDDDIYSQRFGPFDSDGVPLHTAHSESIECYDDELELVEILADYGIGEGDRVGFEWAEDQSTTTINPLKFLKLKEAVEDELGAEIVNANPLIWKVMSQKSELEIERMETAVDAAAVALERIYEEIEVGMNEEEVSRRASRYMMEEGVDAPHHAQVMSEGAGVSLNSCDAVDRELQEGWVHLDIGSTFRRYNSDINRGVFLGREPTEDERMLHGVRSGINEVMDDVIEAGVTVDAVIEAVEAFVEEQGCVLDEVGGSTFLGHSIGMENYNPPNLVPSEVQPNIFKNDEGQVELQPGMMFTYEMAVDLPGFDAPFFNTEDNVVVTEDGVKNMSSRVDRELQVVL